jgi:predicted ATPase
MLIHEIRMSNLLSFGPEFPALKLGDLNVLIGPNSSGKSNLIEAIALLQSAPRELTLPVREGGGIRDWLWKGTKNTPIATVEAIVDNAHGAMPLRYLLRFTESGQLFELVDEKIENESAHPGQPVPYFFYKYQSGQPVINTREGKERKLRREDVDPQKSILSQRKDPDHYPEITYLGDVYGKIRIYREWTFGRYTPPRLPQKADLPNVILEEDFSNLGLVLNRLRRVPDGKRTFLEALTALYEGIDDFDVIIEGGTVQVFFQEGRFVIPATRLSDGTLRYLCLLAILLHPTPPPLVCIEEPELGLHPDVMPRLAELMVDASSRTQLIVTTHSEILVDSLNERPESVVVCERNQEGTSMRRLERKALSAWLEKYSLGQLWRSGEIGGNRW